MLGESPERQAELLRDPATRRALESYESILSAGGDWSRVVLLDNPVVPEYGRRDIASIAAERGQKPLDAVCDLLLAALPDTARLMIISHSYTEAEQREAFAHPLCMPGSDATTLAPDGPLAGCVFHGAYTWAAWFYRFMVAQERLLTPAEAVRRLTGDAGGASRPRPTAASCAPVRRPTSSCSTATRSTERGTTFEPNQLASGVSHVLVNGVVTLRDGALTGDRAGRVLRRT